MLWVGVAVWVVMLGVLVRLPRFFGLGVLISFLLLSTLSLSTLPLSTLPLSPSLLNVPLASAPSSSAPSGISLLDSPATLERGLAPLLLLALGVGLFLPPKRPPRAPRVAPRRGARGAARSFAGARDTTGRDTIGRDTTSPFDLWDIPSYEVLEKVGSGGMASVFRARRKRDGATVALKLPAEGFVSDERFIRRFHREAEVAQRLRHPNIVQTFEHGSVGAKHFMVLEFVDGSSLESYIDAPEHRGDYPVSCELMRQAVRALLHIHGAGIVHRDLKPANLLLRRGGVTAAGVAPDTLKLTDFGIAGGQVLAKTTMTGARVGTPTYMSPEQARGLRTDERSDIYSLGLVFYELLTGETAFKGGYEVILHQQIFGLPPPPRQLDPRIPVQLERLVMQMIRKEPEARPSLAEVEYRLGEPLELPVLASKSRLLCAVEVPGGALRILDGAGNLHRALGNLETTLPAPPQACVSDPLGHLYVAVTEAAGLGADYAMIHKLAPDGALLGSFGHYGMRPGEFLRPVALAVAPDGSLWVLDAETHRLEHFSEGGGYVGGFGGEGTGGGRFNDPRDLLIDPHGDLFVLDYGNRQVQHFGPDGTYQNRWAFRVPGTDPAEGPAGLRQLSGFALSCTGDLYLLEAENAKVHRIAPHGGVLGAGVLDTLILGETDEPRPDTLVDLGVDDAGNLFAAERGGSIIRKYAPSGELLATLETYAPIVQLRVDVRA